MIKTRIASADREFRFSGTDACDGHYTVIGLGKTGCSALSVLSGEGKTGYCTIKIDKNIFSTREIGRVREIANADLNEKISDYLSMKLTDSWTTFVLIDLNDELAPEVLESVACCCNQESILSIAIVIDRTNEKSPSDRHLEIFQKFDTSIHLSRKNLWDISKKTKRLRRNGIKEFSLAHLFRCYIDVLLGNGIYAIDHIDLKNLFQGELVTIGVGIARGEGRVPKAFQQALSIPKSNSSEALKIFACVAISGSTLPEELIKVETALESLEPSGWLADIHSRDELNDDLLLTLFVTSEI